MSRASTQEPQVEEMFQAGTYDTGWSPQRINTGPWFTNHTLLDLEERIQSTPIVLPICSLGTPTEELTKFDGLLLPPLFHEAMDAGLKRDILTRIEACFPYMRGSKKRDRFAGSFKIVELPRVQPPSRRGPRVLCVSIDTSVEEHGPHLPLATDRIQTYAAMGQVMQQIDGLAMAPPAEYGQLAWALPIGLSIDMTVPLTSRYVEGYVNALVDWLKPESVYAVCTHGSKLHHQAIQAGMAASRARRWKFRWLLDPLSDFTWASGDAHAGGVETAMIEHINPSLVDARWWPSRVDDLASGQITLQAALNGAQDVDRWVHDSEVRPWNGIVGDIRNYFAVDARHMMGLIVDVARQDVESLLASDSPMKGSA